MRELELDPFNAHSRPNLLRCFDTPCMASYKYGLIYSAPLRDMRLKNLCNLGFTFQGLPIYNFLLVFNSNVVIICRCLAENFDCPISILTPGLHRFSKLNHRILESLRYFLRYLYLCVYVWQTHTHRHTTGPQYHPLSKSGSGFKNNG